MFAIQHQQSPSQRPMCHNSPIAVALADDANQACRARHEPCIDVPPVPAQIAEQPLGVVLRLVEPIDEDPGMAEHHRDERGLDNPTITRHETSRDRRCPAALWPAEGATNQLAMRAGRIDSRGLAGPDPPDFHRTTVEFDTNGAVRRNPHDALVHQCVVEVDVRADFAVQGFDGEPAARNAPAGWGPTYR